MESYSDRKRQKTGSLPPHFGIAPAHIDPGILGSSSMMRKGLWVMKPSIGRTVLPGGGKARKPICAVATLE
jgi:hypothetical protein